jgi:hypothetical protein
VYTLVNYLYISNLLLLDLKFPKIMLLLKLYMVDWSYDGLVNEPRAHLVVPFPRQPLDELCPVLDEIIPVDATSLMWKASTLIIVVDEVDEPAGPA